MSRLDLPAEPAFSVLRPEPPCTVPASGECAERLRVALGLQPEDVFGLRGPDGLLAGKYACRLDGRPLFIKTVPQGSVEDHLLANRIALHAASRGVRVCSLVEGFPRAFDEGRALLGYPLLEYRFAAASEADMRALGRELAKLHEALTRFPEADRIGRLSAQRIDMLTGLSRSDRSGISGIPEPVQAILARKPFEPSLLLGTEPQPIHGDLNFSNVCFERPRDEPVFIDFETACRSWLSPVCDLALAFDRFVLTAPRSLHRALLKALAEGYGNTPSLGDLLDMLEQTAIRSLLLLTARCKSGLPVQHSEWRKFIDTVGRVRSIRANGLA